MRLPQDNANGYRVSMVSYCRPVLKVFFSLKRLSTWRKIQCLYSNVMSTNLFASWLFGQLRNVSFVRFVFRTRPFSQGLATFLM